MKMAEQKINTVEKRKIVVKAVNCVPASKSIVINRNSKITFLKGEKSNELLKNFKAKTLIKKDVIYESKPGDFLQGIPFNVTLINSYNVVNNWSRTVAKFTNPDGTFAFEKSSDSVTRLIGQKNYDLLFSVLCSVLNQELKVRGIMALLMDNQDTETSKTVKTESNLKPTKLIDQCCQTDEDCMDLILKMKQKKRVKRSVLTPYVVKDIPQKKIKKLIVQPDSVLNELRECKKVEKETVTMEEKEEEFPDISLDDNEGSIGNLSSLSDCDETFLHPRKIFEMIGHSTMDVKMESPVSVTPEMVKAIPSKEGRERLVLAQLCFDWKTCLQPDEDGYLPIHNAVLSDDLDLLRRQCLVFRNKQESVDIPAGNLTALQMSIFQDTEQCTSMLLQYGADPLLMTSDDEHRTSLHLASEVSSDHLRSIIRYCQKNARNILQDNEELWSRFYEFKSDQELSSILLDHMCKMPDGQGYTPLMLASKMGNYSNVHQLVEASPDSVNHQNPNSGSTALFIAVGGACLDAANRGNLSKVPENYAKTISILFENGADPYIANLQGMNVLDVVNEANYGELSKLVCSVMVNKNVDNPSCSVEPCILVKNEEGEVSVGEKISRRKRKTKKKAESNTSESVSKQKAESNNSELVVDNKLKTEAIDTSKEVFDNDKLSGDATDKSKPVILENISLPTSGIIIKDIKTLLSSPLKSLSPRDKLVTGKKLTFDTDKNTGRNSGMKVEENAISCIVESNETNTNNVTSTDVRATPGKGVKVITEGEPKKKKSKCLLINKIEMKS